MNARENRDAITAELRMREFENVTKDFKEINSSLLQKLN